MKPLPDIRDRTVLFLPGYLCTEELFSYQASNLPRGFKARSCMLPAAASMEEIAAKLWENITGRPVICGLSMGGIVAMEMYLQRPEQTAGLILLDTNGWDETETVSAARRELVELGKKIGPGEMSLRKLTEKLLHPGHVKKLRETVYRMAEEAGTPRLESHAEALMNRRDYTPDLPRITCPVLIGYGRNDLICPADRHTHLAAAIPGAELRVFPRCGHLSPLERPKHVSRAINCWLTVQFSHADF